MRYSIEPKERRYVKGYGFLSFVKDMSAHGTKVAKTLIVNMVKSLLILLKDLQQMH